MDRLAFTSLAAVNNQSEIRAQITNNLANVSTIGLKRVLHWHPRLSMWTGQDLILGHQ